MICWNQEIAWVKTALLVFFCRKNKSYQCRSILPLPNFLSPPPHSMIERGLGRETGNGWGKGQCWTLMEVGTRKVWEKCGNCSCECNSWDSVMLTETLYKPCRTTVDTDHVPSKTHRETGETDTFYRETILIRSKITHLCGDAEMRWPKTLVSFKVVNKYPL